jgi:PEP-CTERM motif
MKKTLLTSLILGSLVGPMYAALITGITLESGTTNPFNTIPMGPAKAINGEGLPGGTPALSGTHTTNFDNGWWSLTGPPQITINLSGVYNVDTIHIWNYNEAGSTARSTRNVEIYVSPDGSIANLVKLVTGGSGTHDNGSGDFLLPQGPGVASYLGFDLNLSGVTNASLLNNVRLIQFKPLDSYGGAFPDGVGLAEVQFGAVPEPSAALLGGLGVFALLRRRRRNNV